LSHRSQINVTGAEYGRSKKYRFNSLIRSSHARRLCVEKLEDRRMLAITVDTLTDELDGSVSDGDVSLRDAIAAAIPSETIDFSVTGTILLDRALGELVIDKPLTIEGPSSTSLSINAGKGLDNTLNTGDGFRIFKIDDGGSSDIDVVISGLTLTGGDVGFRVGGTLFDEDGGAIFNNENLEITNVTIIENAASLVGGGISNRGTIKITNSLISRNFSRYGGGIQTSGTTIVTDSTISENSASQLGGGIRNVSPGSALITGSTISHNVAWNGGGLHTRGGVFFANSTISGNTATNRGGGIYNFFGGGTLRNSTLARNAASEGSGVFNFSSEQSANNTIIEGDVDGTSVFGNNNLIGVNPLLGPLADNGGPTQTHALLPGSPALDTGNSALTTDQRGQTRSVDLAGVANAPGGNGSDIGAYEAQSAPSADFVDNDFIDGADFLAWQRGFGTTSDATRADGNADDDGDVDASDLAAWLATYGQVETTPLTSTIGIEQEVAPAVAPSSAFFPTSSAQLVDIAMALSLSSDSNAEIEILPEQSLVFEQVDIAFTDAAYLPATPSSIDEIFFSLGKSEEEPAESQWLAEGLLTQVLD